jgi:YD repeat-containing protein
VYDNKGWITSVTSNAGTTGYVYDALDQLTKETRAESLVSIAWKIPRRVFTYATLRAALRIGIKFVFPALYFSVFYDLAYGFYSGYRYKYRWY